MTPLTVNRSDLAWALTAVLPHTGSAARDLDWVGFDWQGIFATDGYTVGVAEMEWSTVGEEPPTFYLSPSEARDLLKFVRPTLVATHQDSVKLLLHEAELLDPLEDEPQWVRRLELHVGIYDSEGNLRGTGATSEPLSGVWSVRVPGKPFEAVYKLVKRVKGKDAGVMMPYIFKPDLLARLSKAARYETDRLILQPVAGDVYGAAYVTVGDHFEAAVAGLSYELPGEEPGSYEPVDPETVVYGDQYDVEVAA